MKQTDRAEERVAIRLYEDDLKALDKLRTRWRLRKNSEVFRRALHLALEEQLKQSA